MTIGLTLLGAACQTPPNRYADLVFTDGSVLTMDSAAPRAQAVAIKGGRITFVGSDSAAERWIGSRTRRVALGGRTLLPGFQDAHIHPITSGLDLMGCDLTGLQAPDAVLARIRSCADSLPAGRWLVGSNWELPLFPAANPRRELLDSLAPGRPAYFTASDGHSGWASSEALRLANVTRATPDPVNGRIERDRNRSPSGTLREAAMGLVSGVIPPPSTGDLSAAARRVLPIMNAAGITAAQEASGSRRLLETYHELDAAGDLTVRMVVAMRADPGQGLEQVDSMVSWRGQLGSPRVRATAVKIFEDGVIEARTAAMLLPYLDRPGDAGEPNWPAERLDSLVRRLVEADFTVHVHAIGDRAVRLALDAIERAEQGRERGSRRHQIAHLEVIDSSDIARFARLDVIANFQALWAYPDSYIRDLTWPALGPERSRWIYPIGSVARASGPLALGSDWNVSSLVPLEAIQVAITRRDPADSTGPPLLSEQAIDLMTALRAYTLGSARALGLEGETGSIAVGKLADLVVLGDDIERVSWFRIARVPVLLTLVEGVPVHGRLEDAGR
ncbi:MAG TPA: amidohydrolase [Gemmatimonadales bacterium]